MNIFALTSVLLASVVFHNDAKNVCDIQWNKDGEWNSNFRPYGRTKDLAADPSIVRGALEGKSSEGHPTALRMRCDEKGFTLEVFCYESGIKAALESGAALPLPNVGVYLAEGDTDTTDPAFYHQFYLGARSIKNYEWLSFGRDRRDIMPFVRHQVERRDNGFFISLTIDWEAYWDHLPLFDARKDNFWRLNVIRWVDGGLTWGGPVHTPSRFGYIRWPDFTAERKCVILKRLLENGWMNFKEISATAAYNVSAKEPGGGAAVFPAKAPFEQAMDAAEPNRSYALMAADPAFRPELERLTGRANALGAKIAAFDDLVEREQAAFYREAAPMLFNFRYDVEDAYAKYLKAKLMKGGGR